MKKLIIFKRIAASMLLCLLAVTGRAEAKELIFHLGYGLVQVLDADTEEIVADIPVKGWCREAVYSEDKKFIYITAQRHLIHKIDVQTLKLVKTIDLNQGGWQRFIYGIVLAENGKSAYVSIMTRKAEAGDVVLETPSVAQIDLDNGSIIRSVGVPWGVSGLVNVKNDQMIYAVGKDIYRIDAVQKELKIVDTYPMFDKEINILPLWPYTQENGGIFMSPYYTPKFMGLLSIDAKSGEIVETPIKGDMVMAYNGIYSPDKTKAYVIMDDLNVIDLKTNTVARIVPIHEGTSYAVIPTDDGKKIFVGAGGPTVSVFDTETMKVVKVLQMATDGWCMCKITL